MRNPLSHLAPSYPLLLQPIIPHTAHHQRPPKTPLSETRRPRTSLVQHHRPSCMDHAIPQLIISFNCVIWHQEHAILASPCVTPQSFSQPLLGLGHLPQSLDQQVPRHGPTFSIVFVRRPFMTPHDPHRFPTTWSPGDVLYLIYYSFDPHSFLSFLIFHLKTSNQVHQTSHTLIIICFIIYRLFVGFLLHTFLSVLFVMALVGCPHPLCHQFHLLTGVCRFSITLLYPL